MSYANWLSESYYVVSDIVRSLVDSKLYSANVASIGAEPSVSPVEWTLVPTPGGSGLTDVLSGGVGSGINVPHPFATPGVAVVSTQLKQSGEGVSLLPSGVDETITINGDPMYNLYFPVGIPALYAQWNGAFANSQTEGTVFTQETTITIGRWGWPKSAGITASVSFMMRSPNPATKQDLCIFTLYVSKDAGATFPYSQQVYFTEGLPSLNDYVAIGLNFNLPIGVIDPTTAKVSLQFKLTLKTIDHNTSFSFFGYNAGSFINLAFNPNSNDSLNGYVWAGIVANV